MKPGNWVAEKEGLGNDQRSPRIDKVQDAYVFDKEALIDIVIFDCNGSKIGRESEPCGGPTSFEPACLAVDYTVIVKPIFPLPRYGYGNLLVMKE